MLFVGLGVLPSLSGELVAFNIDDTNVNNTKVHLYKWIYIGKIELITKNPPDEYEFIALKVFSITFYQGTILGTQSIRNENIRFYDDFGGFIGIINNNFICGYFYANS
ncbi:Uncharacterised protein [uncultured archaeon]|nr:Uncharacterised protein [uncultured archaeon]